MCPAPKKVLFIHHGGNIGGAPVSMIQLAAALDKEKYTPSAIFTENGPILDFAHEFCVPARVENLRSAFFYSAHVPLRPRMLATFVLHFWATVRETQRIVRKLEPDLVHLNTSVLLPTALGVRLEGVPIVWHVREVPGPHPILRRWQTDLIARWSNHVVVNSEYVRTAFPSHVPIAMLHNALELERYKIREDTVYARVRSEFHLSQSAPVVGMIGSVQAAKGHYLLVEAAREIVNKIPEIRFLIVAGGMDQTYINSWKGRVKHLIGWPMDNLDRMRRMISRLGLEKHFVFTGFRKNIEELLMAMDILAFIPQAAEGFGRPIIEAMAAGCPVVATDIGPSREVLGYDAGLLIPCGDSRALSQAIADLLDDEDRRHSMGTIGRKRANQFDIQQHAAGVQDIYDQLMSPESQQEIQV